MGFRRTHPSCRNRHEVRVYMETFALWESATGRLFFFWLSNQLSPIENPGIKPYSPDMKSACY